MVTSIERTAGTGMERTPDAAHPQPTVSSLTTPSSLTALSPLDGRYAAKVRPLQDHFSEFALIRERVTVEVAWLLALADEPAFTALPPFSAATRRELEAAVAGFGQAEGERIK